MKILLISDTTFHELKKVLEGEGYSVNLCLIKDASDLIKNQSIDLVLIDWGDKSAEGLKTLRDIKVTRPEIPLVVITDSGSEDLAVASFRLGAKDYFKKPINVLELKEALKNLVRLRGIALEKRFPHMTREESVSALLVTATTSMSPNILRVLSYMADHLSQPITLDQLAKEAGISKFSLCRNFQKEVQMSPMHFLTTMRVEKAKKLLKDSALSVSVIALELGFKDIGNFIKNFKSVTGNTPTRYRKSIKALQR
jgi:YesN/AraC family two-component response regulator